MISTTPFHSSTPLKFIFHSFLDESTSTAPFNDTALQALVLNATQYAGEVLSGALKVCNIQLCT